MSNNPIIDRINVKGIEYEIKDTTNNTAGATNSEEKLYLIGAKEQTANPQTFSNSSIYMGASGILTASALSTSTIELPNSCLGLKFIDGDNMYSAAEFNYSSIGGAYLNMNGHLLVNESGGHANKPDNKTGLTSVSYADYFDTGITVCGTASGSGQWYKLSFPGKDGTIALTSDLPTTQQWTLTSTSGTVTTVNICTK